jgi:hypothetical protein
MTFCVLLLAEQHQKLKFGDAINKLLMARCLLRGVPSAALIRLYELLKSGAAKKIAQASPQIFLRTRLCVRLLKPNCQNLQPISVDARDRWSAVL